MLFFVCKYEVVVFVVILNYVKQVYKEMTNDAESTPTSNNQAAFAKQYPNKNANRWSDESNNACIKVTTHSSVICRRHAL